MKDSACGRWPRLFVPVAPYVDWIRSVIDGTFQYDSKSEPPVQDPQEGFSSDSYDQVDEYENNSNRHENVNRGEHNRQRPETLRRQEVCHQGQLFVHLNFVNNG